MDDLATAPVRRGRFGNEFEILYALPDGNAKLPRENNGRERDPGALTVDGLGEEILVASEDDAAQDSGPVERFGILEARGAIILGGQDIHSTTT